MAREATKRRRGERHQTVLLWLTEAQHGELKAAAKVAGTSMAELIRHALAAHLPQIEKQAAERENAAA